MFSIDISHIQLKLQQAEGKTQVFDPIRKKWLVLTPEEHVRQYVLHYMLGSLGYSPSKIAVERKILSGIMPKRFDIVVYDEAHKPWMLVECKSPDVEITETALHQLLQYQRTMQCRYWVLTNGPVMFCADACDINAIRWLQHLPAYGM